MPLYIKKVTNAKGVTRYYTQFPQHLNIRRRRLSDDILIAKRECERILDGVVEENQLASELDRSLSTPRLRAKLANYGRDLERQARPGYKPQLTNKQARLYLHKVTNKKGETRHYSRFPAQFRISRRRLSDDIIEAREQCEALFEIASKRSQLSRYMYQLLAASRACAKAKGWKHDITEEYLFFMIAEQGARCALSGLRFDLDGDPEEKFMRPFAPSLDRKDCKGGYVIGNVRIVCRIVNFGMGPWGYEAYRKAAHAVTRMDPPAPRRIMTHTKKRVYNHDGKH